mgnify:CR=1 FL=1
MSLSDVSVTRMLVLCVITSFVLLLGFGRGVCDLLLEEKQRVELNGVKSEMQKYKMQLDDVVSEYNKLSDAYAKLIKAIMVSFTMFKYNFDFYYLPWSDCQSNIWCSSLYHIAGGQQLKMVVVESSEGAASFESVSLEGENLKSTIYNIVFHFSYFLIYFQQTIRNFIHHIGFS